MDFRIIDATAVAREFLTTRQRTADGSGTGGGSVRGAPRPEPAPPAFDDTFLSAFADSSTITVGDSAPGAGPRASPFPSRKLRTAEILTQVRANPNTRSEWRKSCSATPARLRTR